MKTIKWTFTFTDGSRGTAEANFAAELGRQQINYGEQESREAIARAMHGGEPLPEILDGQTFMDFEYLLDRSMIAESEQNISTPDEGTPDWIRLER